MSIRALYADAGYGARIAADDRLLVAVASEAVIGVVRLCRERGALVLRGMQIQLAWQRHGVGKALLAACVPMLDEADAYCLPYTHLIAFYGLVGFKPAATDELPDFLRERQDDYRSRGQDVLAMVRRVPYGRWCDVRVNQH